jgi:hypothetical protein
MVKVLKIYDEESGELDWDYTDTQTGDDLDTLIYEYMNIYEKISNEDEIEVYRLVKLNTIEDLDLSCVGVYWSFKKEGVGDYGGKGRKFTGDKSFVLNATINTSDINWEYGFYSFLTFGLTEFECCMNDASECLITHINDKELENPIEGIC